MKLRIPDGTPFQQKVWREIKKIPRGKTVTYKELARRVGKPRAVRAVANAVGANKLLVTIPCHRVVRSDGTLGGYAGGLSAKKKLLALEQKFPHKN